MNTLNYTQAIEIKELLNKTEFYLYKISVEKMEVNYGQA